MIRVLLVDDHELVRAGLAQLAGHDDDIRWSGRGVTAMRPSGWLTGFTRM